MTAQIPLLGISDLDSSNETIKPGYHKVARNILFKADRAENIKGTRKISYTLPTGTNECIGSYYDATKQRTIWFNWNSNNNHGIYQMINEVITPITVCAGTDYLNFTKYPIHSVNILFGDDTIGDVLYFIDSLKRPTKINITRAISNGYGTIQRSFLDVAKEPPAAPPVVTYATDGTATVNNLTKALFQFAYSYVFDDKEESTLSFFSEMPVPPGYLNVNSSVTTNAKITLQLQTGLANVKKIKIYARHNVESVYGDLYLIDTLDKSALSIANGTTYNYDFKNNIIGTAADIRFATLLFDSVPREANSQELINGNIVAYGAIKEGYNNNFVPSVSFTVDTITDTSGVNDISQAYSFWSGYSFGLVYFDDKGRTNGVVYDNSFNIFTGSDPTTSTQNIPRVNASISHRPPVWAVSFEWVRTKNNTMSNFVQWISDSTYKDEKFAYIGIQSLYTKLPDDTNKSVITYDFTPGDRVRFISLGTAGAIIGKDFAIEELANSPEISYIPRTGYFLKIKLPTTSVGFDFGSNGYGSYVIQIYTPASVNSEKLNTFYEFGEVYQIGNPGLTTRFHKGSVQDQTTNLSQPARFIFAKGDAYLKQREVTTGSGGQYYVDSGDAWTSKMFVGVKLQSSVVGNETYLLGQTPFAALPLTGVDNQWVIKTQGDAYTFRIKGTIKVNTPVNIGYRLYLLYYTIPDVATLHAIDLIPVTTIVNGDNTLSFDKSFTIPPTSRVFLVTDNTNSQALHYYTTAFTITNTNSYNRRMFDPNFSDTFQSAVNSNGRPFVVDEGLVETFKPNIIRFSEAYQVDTNINKTNRFFDLNYVECDRSKGDIQRLKVRGDILRAYQYMGVLPFGIYKQMLTNADGTNNLIQSEKILNRIKYYDGDFGIGNQPCSLASSSSGDYFTDPIRGYHIRLAGDGMTPISELYRAQYFLPPVTANYLKSYTTDSGSTSKILGVYDFYNEEFVSLFQKCKSGSTIIYAGDTLGFSEQRNGYSSFYDYTPESIVCAENTFVMWKAGEVYIQDGATRNTFFGTFYPSKISLSINLEPNVKKEFLSIGYHSNSVWTSPGILTDAGQSSNLIADDFVLNEGMWTAAFLRDINSIGGIAEGDFLKGVWQQITLQSDSTALAYLTGLYFNYILSFKNY